MTPDERSDLAAELRLAADQAGKVASARSYYWAELMRTAATALEQEGTERADIEQRLGSIVKKLGDLETGG